MNSQSYSMKLGFNPLESKQLFATPGWLHDGSAWIEHVPFAMLLVELQHPSVIVELGTHRGISFCAFCQAVKELGLNTRCYAVDTWLGDSHAGFYDNEIYENLKAFHQQYESFSKLLRMTFDEALGQIPDHTVDLLHIDGLHTYEAVKHDYESWLPKMSGRGIVLFHDTVVKERGFGVHQLWSELTPSFPHFNFKHGSGLGILAVGKHQPDAVINFLEAATARPLETCVLFSALGRQLHPEGLCEEVHRLRKIENSRAYKWGRTALAPLRLVKRLIR